MPSPRAARATLLALVVVVGIVVAFALFVWPGIPSSPSCRSATAPIESIHGRPYCSQVVPVPHFQANYTAWDYGFRLSAVPTPAGIGLNVTVTEPGGGTYSGSLLCGIVCPRDVTVTWFTPDAEAGVSWVETVPEVGNVTLLVLAT